MQSLEPEVYVLRLGHRPERDKRVTTHLALAARALGAKGFILAGECDFNIIKSIYKVERTWGRGFKVVACGVDFREFIEQWKSNVGLVVHLTMYGLPLYEVLDELRGRRKPLLVVVGAEKVPRIVYELADYNVSVTNQPHSEVSALAIFLDRLYNSYSTNIEYVGAKLKIKPCARGKIVENLGNEVLMDLEEE